MKGVMLLLLVGLCGCASYRAFEQDTSRPARNRLKKQTQEGLVIAVEDYSDPQKSQKYFDSDLSEEGYLPIYFCIGNEGEHEFTLRLKDITFRYEDGTIAPLVDVEEIIGQVKSSPAKSLWAFPLLIPVPFIWSSISNANFELEQDYQKKALHDTHITKGDNIFGFIFVRIPKGKHNSSLEDAIIELKVIKKAAQGELAETLNFISSIPRD